MAAERAGHVGGLLQPPRVSWSHADLLSPPPPPDTRSPLLLFTPCLRQAFVLANSLQSTPNSLRCKLAPYLTDASEGESGLRLNNRRQSLLSQGSGSSSFPDRRWTASSESIGGNERSAGSERVTGNASPLSATGMSSGSSSTTEDATEGDKQETWKDDSEEDREATSERAVTFELVQEVSALLLSTQSAEAGGHSSLESSLMRKKSNASSPTAPLDEDKSVSTSGYWVHELLKGSAVYVVPRIKRPRSPSLVARLDQISVANAHAEYARMVAEVANPNDPEFTATQGNERQELKAVTSQITAIINILFTVVGIFFAVYWISPHVTADVGYQILLSFSAAIVVGIAETWLYLRYITRPPRSIRRYQYSRLRNR